MKCKWYLEESNLHKQGGGRLVSSRYDPLTLTDAAQGMTRTDGRRLSTIDGDVTIYNAYLAVVLNFLGKDGRPPY